MRLRRSRRLFRWTVGPYMAALDVIEFVTKASKPNAKQRFFVIVIFIVIVILSPRNCFCVYSPRQQRGDAHRSAPLEWITSSR